ncbi:FAD-dependent monooxygenase [Micromonospora sp. WMMD975]|uniref:FAD-dependent monooxygenase n=1 Tax=Micromonospora sp. WMMD975 TaxID=3016087 RepID=UPI00249BC113|nr:FAD-dependent monooxygenase [Micromonospora sp. WMMD975]WFE35228.1 FAD-dependent monooxygenase [Micromonospora sp. WMMD975]
MDAAVVIAGAGPTGLLLAAELAQAGVPVVVLERDPEPRLAAMGMAINAGVVDLLAERGLMERIGADGLPWPRAHFAQLWLDPGRLPGRQTYTYLLPQAKLEEHLLAHAEKLGVEIRRGVTVRGVRQDADGVAVDTSAGVVTAAYLVGCDGADSVVRGAAGITFEGSEVAFDGIAGDVEVPNGHPLYQQLGANEFNSGLFSVAPSGVGLLRVATGEFGRRPADPSAPPDAGELRAAVSRLIGQDIDVGTPRWLGRWNCETRQADRYRVGRVLVAGEAAHVHFPLGGQALSTNLEDAVNLGWKLAAELAGWAPGGLLDSYHDERHPAGARTCLTTAAQLALLYPADRVAPLRAVMNELIEFDAVNEYLVRTAGGLNVRHPATGCDHPLVGLRVPGVPLPAGRGLALRFDPSVRLDVDGWADRVDLVTAEPSADIAAVALLARPDGRIAWATDGTDPDGLAAALATWFGAPTSS